MKNKTWSSAENVIILASLLHLGQRTEAYSEYSGEEAGGYERRGEGRLHYLTHAIRVSVFSLL